MADIPHKKEWGEKETMGSTPKEKLDTSKKNPTTPPLYPHPDQTMKYKNA